MAVRAYTACNELNARQQGKLLEALAKHATAGGVDPQRVNKFKLLVLRNAKGGVQKGVAIADPTAPSGILFIRLLDQLQKINLKKSNLDEFPM